MDAYLIENARLELIYALALPAEEASKFREDLLCMGVPDNQIVIKELNRVSLKAANKSNSKLQKYWERDWDESKVRGKCLFKWVTGEDIPAKINLNP